MNKECCEGNNNMIRYKRKKITSECFGNVKKRWKCAEKNDNKQF